MHMSCQVLHSLRDPTATIPDKPHGTMVYGDKDRICRGMTFIIERSYGRVCYVAFCHDVTAYRAVRSVLGLPQHVFSHPEIVSCMTNSTLVHDRQNLDFRTAPIKFDR